MAASLAELEKRIAASEKDELARAALEAYKSLHGKQAGAILTTPLLQGHPGLAASSGASRVWLKMESEQYTGSFKARGAVNKLSSLSRQELQAGIITSSTGNHALAVMHAWRHVQQQQQQHPRSTQQQDGKQEQQGAGLPPVQVYVASSAAPHKLERLRAAGAQLVVVGQDCVEAEEAARSAAATHLPPLTYVSPYNDWMVMAGQGTLAIEVLLQLGSLGRSPGAVLVPVGGGGLIAGVASVIKAWDPGCLVIGCQPAASCVMKDSVAAGRVVHEDESGGPQGAETLSDATAGGIEPDSLTLAPCIAHVDDWVLLSEEDIRAAMLDMLDKQGKLVEGAAGCALAALSRCGSQLEGREVVVIVCGGNCGVSTLANILGAQ